MLCINAQLRIFLCANVCAIVVRIWPIYYAQMYAQLQIYMIVTFKTPLGLRIHLRINCILRIH